MEAIGGRRERRLEVRSWLELGTSGLSMNKHGRA